MSTLLITFSALCVVFFGGRFIDRYKRAVDRRDELKQAAGDVPDAVARLHESECSPTRQELEQMQSLAIKRDGFPRAISTAVPPPTSSGLRGEALFGRLGHLPLTSHGRYSDAAIMRDLHYNLRFTLRDLPWRIDPILRNWDVKSLSRSCCRHSTWKTSCLKCIAVPGFALVITDAAMGRARNRNRGMNGRTRQYLFNQDWLPNSGLLTRLRAVEIEER